MGFDLASVFRDPPPYLFALLAVAALTVGTMLWRVVRRHRHGAERTTVRLVD
jgi:hypothetical protein